MLKFGDLEKVICRLSQIILSKEALDVRRC